MKAAPATRSGASRASSSRYWAPLERPPSPPARCRSRPSPPGSRGRTPRLRSGAGRGSGPSGRCRARPSSAPGSGARSRGSASSSGGSGPATRSAAGRPSPRPRRRPRRRAAARRARRSPPCAGRGRGSARRRGRSDRRGRRWLSDRGHAFPPPLSRASRRSRQQSAWPRSKPSRRSYSRPLLNCMTSAASASAEKRDSSRPYSSIASASASRSSERQLSLTRPQPHLHLGLVPGQCVELGPDLGKAAARSSSM